MMEQTKTHWKKLENPDYLGSYALLPGQDLVAQIDRVVQEDVYNPSNNSKESCTVAHFVEKDIRPMILNVTNCKTISKIYDTPYIEEWSKKYISIYIAKVKAFGETVDALRIRTKIPTVENIKCEICGAVITGTGSKTAEEIARLGQRDYGKKLCLNCAKKELKKNKGAGSE